MKLLNLYECANQLQLPAKWLKQNAIEGKSPDRIARETCLILQSVDRYLGQFDRVRHCLHQGFSAVETARILDCSLSLVETYLQMDKELVG
jgi:hypothetical protein